MRPWALLLITFSACGGIRTGIFIPVFKQPILNLPVLSKGILGKGGWFMAPPLEDGLTGLTGSSTPLGLLAYELDVSVNGAMDIIPFPVFVSVNTIFSRKM